MSMATIKVLFPAKSSLSTHLLYFVYVFNVYHASLTEKEKAQVEMLKLMTVSVSGSCRCADSHSQFTGCSNRAEPSLTFIDTLVLFLIGEHGCEKMTFCVCDGDQNKGFEILQAYAVEMYPPCNTKLLL